MQKLKRRQKLKEKEDAQLRKAAQQKKILEEKDKIVSEQNSKNEVIKKKQGDFKHTFWFLGLKELNF